MTTARAIRALNDGLVAPGAARRELALTYARELLELTDLPVDAIARTVGWQNAAALRHHFVRLGTTPLAYRRTFAGASTEQPMAAPAT